MIKRKIEFKEDEINFFKLSKQEQVPQKRVRLIAMGQLKRGIKITEVARLVGIDRHTIGTWYDSYKLKGLVGLDDKPRKGKSPKLARDREEEFLREIENLQNNRSGGRVTGYDIQKLAKNSFDADYANDSIYTVLKRLGFSWITARSKHPKTDSKKKIFLKTILKNSLKQYCQKELD